MKFILVSLFSFTKPSNKYTKKSKNEKIKLKKQMHAFDCKVRKKKVSGIYNIILLAPKTRNSVRVEVLFVYLMILPVFIIIVVVLN